MSVLVTGSNGFIGNSVCSRFGNRALGLQRTQSSDVLRTQCDLTSDNSVHHFLSMFKKGDFSHIVHAAAVTPWSPNPDYANDLVMARSVLLIADRLNIPSILFISGWNVYDMMNTEPPYAETTPIGPGDDYGLSKSSTEDYLHNNAKDVNVLSLRLSSVYGQGQLSTGLIPNLVSSALSDHKLYLQAMHTKRDYIYIDDLVDAIYQLTLMPDLIPGALNIGSGLSHEIREVASVIKDIFKQMYDDEVKVEYNAQITEAAIRDNTLDITQSRALGLLSNPRQLVEGLGEYIRWRKDETVL